MQMAMIIAELKAVLQNLMRMLGAAIGGGSTLKSAVKDLDNEKLSLTDRVCPSAAVMVSSAHRHCTCTCKKFCMHDFIHRAQIRLA